ncbi:non-structural maintenance of chromosomes element 4 homolog A [Cyprinodon tularosa]|nr:PREDICTED: non-structural maintenance of chromosomes element 4 homolog A-like [Cyprinodon variegatus]XP_015253732.1 PREDICTED: non-structural maintenance of chromosomes element 4 homolog A-like [Cyprinodon variegatus]XP_015256954.1 PREDICTED: non-structural maintenance of chromosomes element 4 homolog A-like [Cyprinodon variegatus]XP_015256955.1 PREDICTED: non-structural maintenance of chromosomes element 4 homolog A-like [Cyprinodon variegatus]XP_015256956.1 PREDICTED: non-structural mainte
MRKARAGADEESPRQNGSSSRRRSEQQAFEGEDPDSIPGGLQDNVDDDNDQGRRREIRSKYRDLINSVQQNREDMLSPSNNKLTEVLEEANKLFKEVRQAREAALDAQLLVVATDLGKEKASQLFSEGCAFDPTAFAEHLLSFMGLNRLEEEEENDELQNGGGVDGFLPKDAWHRLARRTECCFKTAPTFHYMMGSFYAEPPPPKQKSDRQRKASSKEVKRIMPTQLKKMEESHQEATEKEVERILGYLKGYFEDDPSPMSYYEFVIDPNSFSRTVENIFHTSFLIRDGLARLYLDDDKLPCIEPVEEEAGATSNRRQCIVPISPNIWRELIDVFEIREAIIQPPETQNE